MIPRRSINDNVDAITSDSGLLAGIDAWLESAVMQESLRVVDGWESEEVDLAAQLEEVEERGFVDRARREEEFFGPGRSLNACMSGQVVQAISEVGCCRVNAALSTSTAQELRDWVLSELDGAVEASGTASPETTSPFSKVLVPHGAPRGTSDAEMKSAQSTRYDFRLAMSPIVTKALGEMFRVGSPLGDALYALSGGSHSELWELAALVSLPGAAPQIVHPDTSGESPSLLTAFVALQPVSRSMGPTRFLPHTHNRGDLREALEEAGRADGILWWNDEKQVRMACGAAKQGTPWPSVVALLNTGDVALYDGRLLHCGGANRSTERRVLFYITLRKHGADGLFDPARSILPELAGSLSIGDLRRMGACAAC